MIADVPIASPLAGTRFIESAFLSPEDRRALGEAAAPPRPFRSGVDLVTEGVRTERIYFLTRGWAARYKTTRDGARQITGLVVPGDICNLDSFMLERINYGVRTLTAVEAVALPRDRAQAIAADSSGVARAFTWFAVVENAILSEWALSMGRMTARERLAHLLCEMSVRLGGGRDDLVGYDLPVTQEQLADALGLTAVHVNRTMQQLKAERLIATAGRRVTVPDMAELRRVGGFDASYLHVAPPTGDEKQLVDHMR